MTIPPATEESRPPHPGQYVRKAMEDLGLSINAFARELDVSAATVHRVVTEKSAISPEMAIRLSMTVGHTAHHWLGYQVDYDLYLARKHLDVNRISGLHKTPLTTVVNSSSLQAPAKSQS